MEHGYLFWLQRELVRYYMEVMSDANVEAETREILNGMMGCIVNRTAFNTQQTMLLNQAVELFSDYYTPFHDMEKEIFGFLNLSYQSFDHKFPDRMLMEFILDWKELLEMDILHQVIRMVRIIMVKRITKGTKQRTIKVSI